MIQELFEDNDKLKRKPRFNTSSAAANGIIDFNTKPVISSTGMEQAPIAPLKFGDSVAFGSNRSGDIITPISTNNPTLGKVFQDNNFQVQMPKFGKQGLDLDGDGIPDGAQVERVVMHQGPNGEQIKDKINWNKPAAGVAQEMNPFLPAVDEQGQARIRMGLDKPKEGLLNPFTSAPTTANEVLELRMEQLKRKAAGDFGGSVASRKAAQTELTNLSGQENERKRLEQKLNIFNAKQQNKINVEAQRGANAMSVKKLEGANQLANTEKQGEWGVNKTQKGNEGKLAVAQEQTNRAREVAGLVNAGKIDEANVHAMSAKTVAEINAETDQIVAKLREAGRKEEAQIVADSRFKMDAPLYMTLSQNMNEQERTVLRNRILNGGGAPNAVPGAAPTAGTPPATPTVNNPPPTTIAPGAVVNGFKFKGGDPQQATSWEKI